MGFPPKYPSIRSNFEQRRARRLRWSGPSENPMTPAQNWSRSKRFFLAATVFGLLALKFRRAIAAGIDLPGGTTDWLSPSGWNAWFTWRNGQWDPFLLRLVNSLVETGVAGIGIALIARCCRPSNGGGWAVLANGGIQLAIASFAAPALVESWRQPWFVALLCGAVLALSFIRRIRIAVLAGFILVAGAAWWCGALRPAAADSSLPGEPRGAAIRQYLTSGNPAALSVYSPAELKAVAAALAQPDVRARLPLSARSALPLGRPVESNFAFVAVTARRAADITGPAAVLLQEPNGRRIEALQGALPADREWHRLNLPIGAGPFSIVTEGSVEMGPAVEYAAGSRDAGKVLRCWPAFAALAVICGLGGVLCLTIPNERHGWKLAWNPRELRLLPWLALMAYAGVLAPFLDTSAGGSDSAGYLGSARLLQHFQLTTVAPVPADLAATGQLPPSGFLPRGFAFSGHPAPGPSAASPPLSEDRRSGSGSPSGAFVTMVPTYPAGLPLLFSFALWSLPAAAAIPAVILFHLLAGLVLTYLLGRQFGLNPIWSLAAAAFLALCPLYLFMGLQPMSDVPALVWVSGAVVLALLARKPSVALACGVATAIAVLIRPSNAIALPIVALALAFRPRALLWWILGGLPFAILQAFYNQHLYGHPFLTGYGSAGGLFSAEWIGPTVLHYLRWLPVLLTPAVVAVLALPFCRAIVPSAKRLVSGWAGLFLVFYATYRCTHETWWYLRFLLPAAPALILGTLLVLRQWANTRSSPFQGYLFGTAAALGLAVWLLVTDSTLHVLESGRGNQVYADSSRWLEQNAPANALVVCSYTSGALYYYSHRAFFQPSVPADAARVLAAAASTRRPVYAEFFQFDQEPLAWFAGGHWAEVHRSGNIIIWRWVSSA